MIRLFSDNIELTVNSQGGVISSLKLGGVERCVHETPLFVIRLRDVVGEAHYLNSTEATSVLVDGTVISFSGFSGDFSSLLAKVVITADAAIDWRINVHSVPNGYAVEWIEFPKICLPKLIEGCEQGGKILFPYNEGMLVSNENLLPRYEPEFPSSGAYFTFPNMVCSQFMAYLFDDVGLYIGAHDIKRGLKGVDFYPYEGGLALQMRLYSGCDFGQDFIPDFPIVWKSCTGNWMSAAEIYRDWFEKNLPPRAVTLRENDSLPEWYKGSPLIVTYPVRGWHDYDSMEPNDLFPFTNALPILNYMKEKSGAQIMSLLMHWEGTAPWAPPYVWPPYGGEEGFNKFKEELHKNGDLLGVYCSGFGYTLHSKLTEYNNRAEVEKGDVLHGVCHSPQNKPELGITCTYQRVGYDICPASDMGRKILDEAYAPLFATDIDYIQILDQNHGGGQYLCYAREHNHPPMPGEWMTGNMQSLLNDWNSAAPHMVFGCESAAAEPFIGNLLMSDNRYELNYPFGKPVPVYAFIYHEYLRNFMGNQCGCPFEPKFDTQRYRMAYSFSIGDIMTMTLAPNGKLMSHWGTHDFESAPDMDKALTFVKNVTEFYNGGAKEYLYGGKMKNAPEIKCEEIKIPLFRGQEFSTLPRLLSSCWEAKDGKTAYIVVNPEDEPVPFSIEKEKYECPALNAVLIIK